MTALRVALVALLLMGCTMREPAVVPTDSSGAVLESRELLGDPMVELATEVIGLSDALDAARHQQPRGAEMKDALDGVAERTVAVEAAADAAERAAEQAPVEEAAEVVLQAAQDARDAVEATHNELEYLNDVADIDTRLDRAVTAWDAPGSQSEIRRRLLNRAEDIAVQRRAARALDPVPSACTQLRENRLSWARTVRVRTLELQVLANSAGGRNFDELRAAYRRLPFGAEPRTADREDRECWREASDVAQAAAELRAAVDELEDVLRG